MRELSSNEVEAISGGDNAAAISYGTGLAGSALIGASLGPVGVAVAAATFTASFAITYYFVSDK